MSYDNIALDESFEIPLNHDNIDSSSTQSFIYYENDEKYDNSCSFYGIKPNYHIENKKDPNYIFNTLISLENEKKQDKIEFPKIIEKKVTKNVFQTETKIKKPRGIQINISRKKRHINRSFDNLQTKIQVHFLSFIINICNDALNTELHSNKDCFKEISYDIKRNFSYQLFEEYKKSPIQRFLTFNISTKYKIFKNEHNLKLLSRVYSATEWLNKFFNMNYLKLFEYYFYYNKEKQMNKIYLEGKNIILSKNTKTFCDLLEKKENEEIKKELNEAAVSVYFHDYKLSNGKFISSC